MIAESRWWLRLRASAKHEDPWPAEFLDRLTTETRALRRRAQRQRRSLRRLLAKGTPS